MIKEIRCQFEDVKEFQRFILNDKEYIKVSSPNMPFKIKVIKRQGGWQSEEYENFSPNAYNLKRRQYAEIGLKEDCIVYPKAESEEMIL